MTKDVVFNLEKFLKLDCFDKTNKDSLKKYILDGNCDIPNDLPSVGYYDLEYDYDFDVINYLTFKFFKNDYDKKCIDIYIRWVLILKNIINDKKDRFMKHTLVSNLKELDLHLKECMDIFELTHNSIVFMLLEGNMFYSIEDKVIQEYLEIETENNILDILNNGELSSFDIIKKVYLASKFSNQFKNDINKEKIFEYIKGNIDEALVEAMSSYKRISSRAKYTDKKAVEAVKSYLKGRNLKENLKIIKEKLAFEYGEYKVLETQNIKVIINIAIELVKEDIYYKKIINLLQEIQPNQFLTALPIEFDSIDNYVEMKNELVKSYVKPEYILTYSIERVSKKRDYNELFIRIMDYEKDNVKDIMQYLSHESAAKVCFNNIKCNDEYYLNYAKNKLEEYVDIYVESEGYYEKDHFKEYIWVVPEEDMKNAFKKVGKYLNISIMYSLTRIFLYMFDNNIELFLENAVNMNIDLKVIAKMCVYYFDENRNKVLKDILIELFKYHKTNIDNKTKGYVDIFKSIKNEEIESKMNLINIVFDEYKLLQNYAGGTLIFFKDKSKNIRQYLADKFYNMDDSLFNLYLDKFEEFLNDSKEEIRLLAINVMSNHLELEEIKILLKGRFEIEKELKARNRIIEILDIDPTSEYTKDGVFDLIGYFNSLKIKKSKNVLDFDNFPKIRLKDSDEYVSDEILNYLIKAYLNSTELGLIKDATIISSALNKEDLAKFSNEVYNSVIKDGIDMKKKGFILFVCVHGNIDTIENIKKLIDELASNSRHKLAQYTVKALVLNGSSTALTIVNSIKNKYKYKSVKESAKEAFEIAAREFELNTYELEDKIIPTLGFENENYKEYDYGNRIIKVFLTDKLEIEIENEKGKILKNLPKASKDDIEEKVKLAKDDLKGIKKELKLVKKLQIQRLEEALLIFRKWSVDDFENVFIKNPIMNRLGKTLVWGAYEGDNLIKEFMYDDDLYDMDYEKVEFGNDIYISLIHPLDLDEDKIEGWKEVIQDNEIVQIFPQLNREVYVAKEGIDIIKEFKSIKINAAKLVSKFSDMGWFKGSVKDAGCYYELYREFEDLGFGVEITVDDYLDFYDNAYKDVSIKHLEFYKAKSIERGSYIYDEIDENRRIKALDIPKRLYSEIIYSVYRVLK
ncbi:DUF4132 domain-containing protein [Tepidibacter hydrothermalis]|uniref:DUF4132 domain-containing protein n=1 Tax=Tepidibacter hydrothermalis TaxID=3036126 RepID=A0ABY8E900_9FIRM|nr:DUF4132 domain-containing protein [Tepidibacter hydrothermalis]WFD09386.1 DUF4132 domain-containing protein [Tepidibacter hydrothermalis]